MGLGDFFKRLLGGGGGGGMQVGGYVPQGTPGAYGNPSPYGMPGQPSQPYRPYTTSDPLGVSTGGAGAPGTTQGGGILGWAKQNPTLAASLLGAGTSIYGAYKTGQAEDRDAQMREDDMHHQWEKEQQEKERKEAMYNLIMSRRAGG